ncbi:hypothetical protein UAW_00291 [Enterococcus haemoperoxidus ATCC BAA-382]|uniref:MarR family transcriptional regulator n=1 Tax=Enterococcus haemoperoxidus ATCC BAA-382 TaxID=1158608 RepID=R2TJ05_9ENTE|nr:DUF488 domain-containing protein [Enterococcus haemoperoxidus]EOI00117.1 hypothetical protein UAW_00291 [Enterococcus haemoperoxidus ATCC BAA-382]EOT63117.1 hypothetical protein I583_02120 [Enterococcus haemoperoxidus ATCC BAA-382]
MIQTKRAYENVSPDDGFRVLVDRIWPRGMSKEKEQLNVWLKDIAPSNELRKWFNHEPDKFPLFKEQYLTELQSGETLVAFQELLKIIKEYPVITLIYSAKDEVHNNARVLKEVLEKNE